MVWVSGAWLNMRALGYGDVTGIELPAEQDGLVPDPSWKRVLKRKTGQPVTPILQQWVRVLSCPRRCKCLFQLPP
jgi:hypothetical protein